MTSYYEILGVAPSAGEAEIEEACDALYDKWHRLTTHHSLGDQALQNLRVIETIRATLSDSQKRAVYDGVIGVESMGGLIGPDLQAPPIAPPTPFFGAPPAPQRLTAPAAPVDPWACPECGTHNLERSKFCVVCTAQLIRPCPNCGQMTSLVATGNCWECGASFERATTEQRVAELQARIAEIDALILKAGRRLEFLQQEPEPWRGLDGDFEILILKNLQREAEQRDAEVTELEGTLREAPIEREGLAEELSRLQRALGVPAPSEILG
jgi:hypothetical protein